jgi:3-oxoacyl-ACP reductase-like protein
MTTAAPAQQKLQITKTESAVAIIGSLTQALGAVFSRGASLTPAQAQAQAQVAAAAAVSGNPADVAAATTAEEAGKVAGKATGDFFETVRKNLGVISIGGLALVLFMSGRKR